MSNLLETFPAVPDANEKKLAFVPRASANRRRFRGCYRSRNGVNFDINLCFYELLHIARVIRANQKSTRSAFYYV